MEHELLVLQDWRAIAKVPVPVPLSLILLAISKSYQALGLILDQPHEAIVAALLQSGHAFDLIESETNRSNVDYQNLAIETTPAAIVHLPDPSDEQWIRVVRRDALLLRYNTLQSAEVVKTALQTCGDAIQYVQDATLDMEVSAVGNYPNALRHISKPQDVHIVAALKRCGYAIVHVKNPTQAQLTCAINKNPGAIRVIKNPTAFLCRLAIELDPLVIKYVPRTLVEYNALAVRAVQIGNRFTVSRVLYPSTEVVLASLSRDVSTVQHMRCVDNSETISWLAHRMWALLGKPDGEADLHWHRAQHMLRTGFWCLNWMRPIAPLAPWRVVPTDDFDAVPIRWDLIERMERVTGKRAHHWFRRGLVPTHRGLDTILDAFERRKPIYIYTGRGPSSQSMHLGHLMPFMLSQWLQDTFGADLVVQISDDEKFLTRTGIAIDEAYRMGVLNTKQIMSCGLDPLKTHVFSNVRSMAGALYRNTLRVQSRISVHRASRTFGWEDTVSIGQMAYPAVQIAPSIPTSFAHLDPDAICLVPCALDQDVYFRLARDVLPGLGHAKPALIHVRTLPGLPGIDTKMSSSDPGTAIFLDDDDATVERKIKRHAFSGGKPTLAEHRTHGGDPEVDVAFAYLVAFLSDDSHLERVRKSYCSGELLTGDLKALAIREVCRVLKQFRM